MNKKALTPIGIVFLVMLTLALIIATLTTFGAKKHNIDEKVAGISFFETIQTQKEISHYYSQKLIESAFLEAYYKTNINEYFENKNSFTENIKSKIKSRALAINEQTEDPILLELKQIIEYNKYELDYNPEKGTISFKTEKIRLNSKINDNSKNTVISIDSDFRENIELNLYGLEIHTFEQINKSSYDCLELFKTKTEIENCLSEKLPFFISEINSQNQQAVIHLKSKRKYLIQNEFKPVEFYFEVKSSEINFSPTPSWQLYN